MVGFLGCEHTLMGHIQLFTHQHPQVLLLRANSPTPQRAEGTGSGAALHNAYAAGGFLETTSAADLQRSCQNYVSKLLPALSQGSRAIKTLWKSVPAAKIPFLL